MRESQDDRNKAQQPAVQLVTVYESTLESEISFVSTLLKENGIVSTIKNEGTGSYLQIYSGTNYMGTSICVNEADEETAKSLIQRFWGHDAIESHKKNQSPVQSNKMYNKYDDREMRVYRQQYQKLDHRRRNLLKILIFTMFGAAAMIMAISYIKMF